MSRSRVPSASQASTLVANHLQPLQFGINSNQDYKELLTAIGDSKVVLIGEASHGTHEFYRERARISQLLIEQKGFNIVAAESDWPDAYRINRYLHGISRDRSVRESLSSYKRFPLWMWRNHEVEDFLVFLREHNQSKPRSEDRVSFFGMDLYSLHTSASCVIEYLQKVDLEASKRAKQRYAGFMAFGEDTQKYGYLASLGLSPSCETACIKVLQEMLANAHKYTRADGYVAQDELFYNTQNAMVVANAEKYYRSMFSSRFQSWNLRDQHMTQTLQSLLIHTSQNSNREAKAVVWAHNSHLGDARQTDMGTIRNEVNVGQLARQTFGENQVYNIGFTTHTGRVVAADDWDEPPRHKKVNPSLPDSIERTFHQASLESKVPNYLLLFKRQNEITKKKEDVNEELNKVLEQPALQRAIGVVYRPDTERWSHYYEARISRQFDSVIHIDTTKALRPLDSKFHPEDEDETVPLTYPEGM